MFNHQQSSAPKLKVLVFHIGNLRCGLHEEDVTEVVAAVSLTPLPGAPPIVKGVISVRGVLTPVLDLRPHLDEPPKSVSPTDHFILTRATGKLVALHVDRADSLVALEQSRIDTATDITRGEGILLGVAMMPDGLMLIADPTKFLSEAESKSLEKAMSSAVS